MKEKIDYIFSVSMILSLIIVLIATINLTFLHIIYLPKTFYLKIQEGILLIVPAIMLLIFRKYNIRFFNVLAILIIIVGIINLVMFKLLSYI